MTPRMGRRANTFIGLAILTASASGGPTVLGAKQLLASQQESSTHVKYLDSEDAIPEAELVTALADVDPQVREAAVFKLVSRRSKSEELVRALVDRLESDTGWERGRKTIGRDRWNPHWIAPVQALKQLQPSASLVTPLLRPAMASPERSVRLQATEVLLDVAERPGGEAAGVGDLLLTALEDPEPAIRLHVPKALAGLGVDVRRKAVAILLDRLRQADRFEQLLACTGLAYFQAEAAPAVKILSDRLSGVDRPRGPSSPSDEAARPFDGPPMVVGEERPDEPVDESDELTSRGCALYLLGLLGPVASSAVPDVVRAMTAADAGEFLPLNLDEFRMKPRSWHAYDIDQYLDGTVKTGVYSWISHSLRTLGPAALERFGAEAERQAVGLLAARLRIVDDSQPPSENDSQLAAVAQALAALGPKASAAFPALLEAAQRERPEPPRDSDWAAMFHLMSAMSAVTEDGDPRLGDALVRLMKSGDPMQRSAASSVLSSLRPPPASAIPVLIEALHDETQSVRCSAALALGRCEAPEARTAVPSLYDLLRDEDGVVRFEAMKALANLHEDASRLIPTAVQLLRGDDVTLRLDAARILETFGPKGGDAVSALEECQDDENPAVRFEVEKALKAVRPAQPAGPSRKESE